MGNDIAVEIHIDFGCAQDHGIHHGSEISLAVVVVRSEGRRRHMPRIAGDGLHSFEIEGLPVEDVIGQAFLEHFDQVARRSSAHEAGFHSIFFHHAPQEIHEGQCDSSGACLKREPGAHDS